MKGHHKDRQAGRRLSTVPVKSVGSVVPYAMPLACWTKKTHLAYASLLEILEMGKGPVILSHQGR